MNKLKKLIGFLLIPQDKANHFMYGSIIFLIGNYVYLSSQSGLLLALFFALGKEMYDSLTHKPEWKDVLWTMLGAGVACLSALTGFYW
jgi:uncharacterized protein YfiM (DUF2279 family)